MKTITQSSVITPTIIGLALLFAAITFIGVTGKKVPMLSNIRVDIVLLVIIGMTICSQGGIGRVAATGEWTHPLSIIGYLLGGLILIITHSIMATSPRPTTTGQSRSTTGRRLPTSTSSISPRPNGRSGTAMRMRSAPWLGSTTMPSCSRRRRRPWRRCSGLRKAIAAPS